MNTMFLTNKWRVLLLAAFLLACPCIHAQSPATNNYIRVKNYYEATVTGYTEDISYVDGLGRPLQEVLKGASTQNRDIIATHLVYDQSGRDSIAWLSVSGTNGGGLTTAGTISAQAASYYGDSKPYSKTEYEPSPLRRVSTQYGPGSSWQNSGKGIKTEYLANDPDVAELKCRKYAMSGASTFSSNGNYAKATLYVTKTTAENGTVSYTFTNSRSKVVLERVYKGTTPHDTYYIYDHHDQLCYVLPPLASDALTATGSTWALSTTAVSRYAYFYEYDLLQRVISKKLPGCQAVVIVYDQSGRPILTQDGNRQALGKWSYTYYTVYGEVAETGECTIASLPLGYTASQLSAFRQSASANRLIASRVTTGSTGYSYSGIALAGRNPHVVHYYDDYGFLSLSGFSAHGSMLTASGVNASGLPTGSMVSMYGNASKIYTVYHYNARGELSKKMETNAVGGYDITNTTYTFSGQPLTVEKTHSRTSPSGTITELYTYGYDARGRLLTVKHKLDNGSTYTLATQTYDEVGRLKTKLNHGTSHTSTYSYNLRSWVTGIAGNRFTQNLYYNTGPGTAQYGGNISAMTWKSGVEAAVRGYKFAYDGLGQLTGSTYGEGTGITGSNKYGETFTYDKHGNALTVKRYGNTTGTTYSLTDNLTLSYTGNQLKYVNDAVTATVNEAFHFRDGINSTGNEYTYDSNGNTTKDLNKNISKIAYNSLNLPDKVTWTGGNYTSYVYDAAGAKRRVIHQTGSVTKTTDYCGNVIYENGVLKCILTDEGYIAYTGSTPVYYYYLRDHLGNNRVVINSSGAVQQVNHYYAFGGLFGQLAPDVQRFKYNGKELDTANGLDLYDYHARQMDAALGRFTTVDPLAEKKVWLSPYHYCSNNPVNRIDPNGKDDYRFLSNGKIHIVKGTLNNGKPDRLLGAKGSYITVNDKTLLPGLSKIQSNSVGKLTFFHITNSIEDAANVFQFAAKNTSKEWKLQIYTEEGERTASVSTQLDWRVSGTDEKNKGKEKIIDIHSHPDGGKDTEASDADKTNAGKDPNVKRAIYHPYSNKLYEYNDKGIYNTGPVEQYNDIFKYIDKDER